MQNQDFFGFPFENAQSLNLSRAGGHRVLWISSCSPAWFLWEISCALAETHIGSENKHAYGKT